MKVLEKWKWKEGSHMLNANIILKIKDAIVSEDRFSGLDFGKLLLAVPRNPDHGDFSTNFALINASLLKTKPLDLAQDMLNVLTRNKDPFFEKISIEKPGFINFIISLEVIYFYFKISMIIVYFIIFD